jgi:hypothetical protein
MLTDGKGIPLGLAVGGANAVAFKLVEQTVLSIPVVRPSKDAPEVVENLCLDTGYDNAQVRELEPISLGW